MERDIFGRFRGESIRNDPCNLIRQQQIQYGVRQPEELYPSTLPATGNTKPNGSGIVIRIQR